ncbi:MAG: ubiquinol-cytochrome c reductase iron-sulfur subunit [Xanthomonadales bacterium]|nr:ubiquinol-cytochrome c reductase iron-sulfur subunit [Xanthomonadales bacterium]
MSSDDNNHAQPADPGRRRMLIGATSAIGAVGVGFVAVPFIQSWMPSERAKAVGAPVEVDLRTIKPDQIIKVMWRGQTIGIMNRSKRLLDRLTGHDDFLLDPASAVVEQQPEFAVNVHRSIKPEWLVFNMHCTHLGCIPQVLAEPGSFAWEADWPGGFFCPCHKSKFDLSGRVFKGVPAPTNLIIPPYSFIDDNTVIIGVTGAA